MRLARAVLASFVASAFAGLGACDLDPPEEEPATPVAIFVTPELRGLVSSFVDLIPNRSIGVATSVDPWRAAWRRDEGTRIALAADLDCGECYRIDGGDGHYFVHGGGVLGAQYGLADLFEAMGVRFFHPAHTRVPSALAAPWGLGDLGRTVSPERRLRGLHLHTLHPTEGYFAFWEPGADNLEAARRVVDWTVKNRGNYVQWVALDDIYKEAVAARWREHTRAILEYAHARGVRTGIGIQLFGTASLQRGFVLLPHAHAEGAEDTVRERLHLLLDGLAFDRVNLSFGEFSGSDPAAFVASVDLAHDVLRQIAPRAEMAATIHVGNYPKLRASYQGETLLYYFLVKFARPEVVPWVHTVMYYDLFEDAGGAYAHDVFDEHRAFLLERLRARKPVGYFPETAYWCAFDDSVPTYLPLYVRSRWLDLVEIRGVARAQASPDLDEHVLFSTGWEWGYWQNDYAALRASHTAPARWSEAFSQMFAPWGAAGARLAEAIADLGEIQREALIGKRLAPWLAGRDDVVDLGDRNGIIAAPDRPSFAEIAAMSQAERTSFRASVVESLRRLGDETEAVARRIETLGLPASDPWVAEIADGVAIDVHRARFAHAILSAMLAFLETSSDGGWLAKADGHLADAKVVVSRRHGRLHDPRTARLLARGTNSTIYPFGYLYMADQLCYWQRERVQARNAVLGANDKVPACVI